jgi:uncharacterized protein involved in exopolysaccharide biosynthesis
MTTETNVLFSTDVSVTERPPTERPFRKRWLLLWAVLGAVVGAGIYSSVPKIYEASASIQVVPPRVPEGFLKTGVTVGLDQRLGAMVPRLLSRSRLESLIQEFNLYERERRDMLLEDVIERMLSDIAVRPNGEKNATAFSISFRYEDAVTTMRVVARLAHVFINESYQDREVALQGFYQFLESEAEEMRLRLAENESRLSEWAVKQPQRRPPQELVIENEVFQERYKTILRNTGEAEMAVHLETRQIGEQFRLVEAARRPEKPIRPSLWPYLVVGALGGMAFRLLLRLVSSFWRRRRMQATPVPA